MLWRPLFVCMAKRIGQTIEQLVSREAVAVLAGARAGLIDSAYDVKALGESAVTRWAHRPEFVIEDEEVAGVRFSKGIYADGQHGKQFQYVDQGTGKHGPSGRPYPIPKNPQSGKMLKFRTGYSAKTAPVANANAGIGQATGPWVSKAQVMHPGIEARKFMETFVNKLQPTLKERIDTRILSQLTSIR